MTTTYGLRGLRGIALVGVFLAITALPRAEQPTPTNTTAPLPSDPLFDDSKIQRLDLWMASIDWEKLKANFQTNNFYPAKLIFNGQSPEHEVAIRSRGLGSRSDKKPGIRVDFNRYTDQEFLGLRSLVLDNLTQDRSAIHETVTMKLFAKLGIPAPREAHARLYVNNQYVGLYALVEEVAKPMLARVFGSIGDDTQNDGYLYEFNYVNDWKFSYLGPDLEQYMLRFSPKTHESKSNAELYGPLENLVRLANELRPDEFLPVLGEHLDLHAFVKYIAAQNFVGQNDGFLGYAGMNNFYIYRLENSSKHVFIAWDEDNAFFGPEFPIRMRHEENVLMNKAMQVGELREAYDNALLEAARLAEEPTGPDGLPWLEYETRRQLDLLYDSLSADPVKPYTTGEHENERNAVITFARDRSRFVRDQLSSNSSRVRRP